MNIRRPIPVSLLLFCLIAVVASAGFVRLGIWQLDRHREVRRDNEVKAAKLAQEPVKLDSSLLRLSDMDDLFWRRVEVSGKWDFDHEVVIRSRALAGTPGIHVVTPMRLDVEARDGGGEGPSVLVLRGWLRSADAATAQLTSARPEAAVNSASPRLALVRASRSGQGGPMVRLGSGEAGIPSYAAIDVELIAADADGDEVLPFFLQLLPDDGREADRSGQPYPVPLPSLGNGPHLVYMIQWFAFALITLIGTGAFLRREMRCRGYHGPPE